jgi:hypothetical protein
MRIIGTLRGRVRRIAHGDLGADERASADPSFDAQPAAEEMDPFPHADEPERVVAGHFVAPDATPVVAHLDEKPAAVVPEGDGDPGRACVADDVREGLLHEPKDGDRPVGVERDLVVFDRQPARDPGALLELPDLPLEGGDQPEVVDERGSEVACDRLHALERRVDDAAHALHLFRHRRGPAVEMLPQPREVELQRGERLTELVVDLARNPASLLFAHVLEAPQERSQLNP